VPKLIQWRKDSIFNKCCWENWIYVCKKLKLDTCLLPCTNINSKWIKDQNIRPETLKLIWERTENTFQAIGISSDFLVELKAVQQLRESIDKWDTEIKKLLHNKRNCH
jgi:hypothetical protein